MLADRSHTYLVPDVEVVDMVAEQGFAVPRFFVGWIAKNIGLLVKISDD